MVVLLGNVVSSSFIPGKKKGGFQKILVKGVFICIMAFLFGGFTPFSFTRRLFLLFFQWVFDLYSGRNSCSGVPYFFFLDAVGGSLFSAGFVVLYHGQYFTVGFRFVAQWGSVFSWVSNFYNGRCIAVGFQILVP